MNAVPADCRHAARRSFSFVTVATVSLAAHAALVPPPDQFPVASGTDVQLGILADVTAVTASSDGTGHMGRPEREWQQPPLLGIQAPAAGAHAPRADSMSLTSVVPRSRHQRDRRQREGTLRCL